MFLVVEIRFAIVNFALTASEMHGRTGSGSGNRFTLFAVGLLRLNAVSLKLSLDCVDGGLFLPPGGTADSSGRNLYLKIVTIIEF